MQKCALKHLFHGDEESEDTILHELARIGAFKEILRLAEHSPGGFKDIVRTHNAQGELCTHLAAKVHSGLHAENLMKVLEEIGVDLNWQDGCAGNTVLHTAVRHQNYKLAAWLCRQPKVNVNARNYAGLTAYQMAYKNGDKRLQNIFRRAGADCEKPDTSSEESDG